MAEVGLAAAIAELRRELYDAQSEGAGEQFAFEIEEAQLELMLELRNQGQGGGKLSFGVASVDLGGNHSSARTHKLVLKLKVKDRATGGGLAEVSDEEVGVPWGEDD
ncbi:trypco2 family protein [Streptomyces sp. NPDC047085]|uniref:trypco2 family protein n=1 Tax=Streptomyces sp. NPDC047085 TaxID=3155140 RepID=UPI0033D7C50C